MDIAVSIVSPTYGSELVTLDPGARALSFTLEEGTHTVSSAPVVLGRLPGYEGRRLLGVLTFTYTYAAGPGHVVVCGPTFESADAMHLTTYPEGTDETCLQRAVGGLAEDERGGNLHWSYRTPLTPGLEDVFRNLAGDAARAVVAALEATPGLRVHVRTPVPDLSVEDHRGLLALYQDGTFQAWRHPDQTPAAATAMAGIESVWGGIVRLGDDEILANVIGSTPDPKIGGLSWLRVWTKEFGPAGKCTSYQFAGGHTGAFRCGSGLVGGHVVRGPKATVVPVGSALVYIVPICHAHNNDDSVYMKALTNQNAIWLKRYLQ